MEDFIGIKQLKASPMTRAEYNNYRGWDLPADENGADEGYLVEYADGLNNTKNHANHDGYISWSPKEVFEMAYRPMKNMSYSLALELVKQGKRVQRVGWNGKGMFIFLVPGSTFTVNREPLLSILGEGTTVNYHGHIDMKTADGMIVPWLCSQTDGLANDWQVI